MRRELNRKKENEQEDSRKLILLKLGKRNDRITLILKGIFFRVNNSSNKKSK